MSKAKTTQKKTATKNTLKKKKTIKSTRGRKLFDGKSKDSVIAKLEGAFSVGATDEEACLQADISVDALYRYQKENPEFRKRKEMLKEKLVLAARVALNNVISETEISKGGTSTVPTTRALDTSKWYLERKKRSEFAPSFTGIIDDGKGGGVLTEERKAEIAGALHNWEDDEDEDD